MNATDINKILSGCLQETVTVYFRPNGQHGMFLRFTGILKLSARQPAKGKDLPKRWFIGDWRNGVTFTTDNVMDITDRNTAIHLSS